MPETIRLDDLIDNPGLSRNIGNFLVEACKVTLHRSKHVKRIKVAVTGVTNVEYSLEWDGDMTDQILRAWAEQLDAIEHAAVCIALLLAPRLTTCTEIERSARGTGVDYWLGDSDGVLFQQKARLEVSGILKGTDADVKRRYKMKSGQSKLSDSTRLPAYVSITEFGAPQSKFALKQ